MQRHILPVIVLIFAAAPGCDRSSKGAKADTPTETAAAEATGAAVVANESVPVPDEPPEELATKEMPVGEPLKFVSVDSKLQRLLEADDGEQLCLDDVFADENRFTADSRENCFKSQRDKWWTLYGTESAKPLASFTSVIEYGDEFDAIRVSKVIEDGEPAYGPGGKTPPHYNRIIGLKDGRKYAASQILHDRYHFVDGKRVLLVSTTERDPFRLGIAVVDEIPTAPVETVETDIIPTGKYEWDEERELITFTGRDGCRFGTVELDGSDAKCRLTLPHKYFSGRRNWMLGDWFVATGETATDRAVALNIQNGERLDPSDGTCAEPWFPHVSSGVSVPRLLIACTDAGRRPYEPTQVWLWTPEKRYEVIDAPWRADRAIGDYVSFRKGVGTGATDVRWLDLKRYVYWAPGALYLVGHNLASNSFPLTKPVTTEFYVIDDSIPQLRKLGDVECDGKVFLTHRDDEVVSALCSSGNEAGCGVSHAPIIDYSITWDLRTGKKHRTDGILAGVTKDALLFHEARLAKGGDKACMPTVLAKVDR